MRRFYDREIDFHGYYPTDATRELEELLFCSVNESILVIHGMGSGKVKHAVRTHIRNSTQICSFEYGEQLGIPGGDGVVVVWT